MKLLKIDSNCGYFLDDQGKYQPVDKMTKEHLLRLVDITLGDEDVHFDAYAETSIKNQAHQIVYKSVFQKLIGLQARKQEFIDESARLFLKQYEKYREDVTGE